MTIYAVICSHTNGYKHDKEQIKALGNIGDKFELEKANVGSWHTTVYLKGHKKGFNSVNFEFENAYGVELDIVRIFADRYSIFGLALNSSRT